MSGTDSGNERVSIVGHNTVWIWHLVKASEYVGPSGRSLTRIFWPRLSNDSTSVLGLMQFTAILMRTFILIVLMAVSQQSVSAQMRIVFLGDSITEAGVQPDGYVSLVADSLSRVDPDIEVVGAGISGNKVPDLLARLDSDVLALSPTHVIIYIGINDVWHHFEFDHVTGTDPDVFEAGLHTLINRLRAKNAMPLLCTPSVIGEDPTSEAPVNRRLSEYADISRGVADSTGVTLCDLRAAFEAHLNEHNPDKSYEGILTSDGVHLNAAGNGFVARFMLDVIGRKLDL